MTSSFPIVVVGAGPAGLWLAAHLARRGVELAVIDPQLDAPWPNTYGVWRDELEGLEIEVPTAATFNEASVWLHPENPTLLERAYVRVDPQAFRQRLLDELRSRGATLISEAASSVSHDSEDAPLRLTLEGGRNLDVRAIVDATGRGVLRHRAAAAVGADPTPPEAPGVQSALGWLARFERDPLEGHPFVMMDFRPPPTSEAHKIPTFLYGMHLGEDLYFVEETALVTRKPLSFEELEVRLRARLNARDALPTEILEVERCLIPMGGDPPSLDAHVPPIIAFGAAAGFVHPATGYSLAHTLRTGAPLADLLADALASDAAPADIARSSLKLLWPAPARRSRALYALGQEAVLAMNTARLTGFFTSFFALPDADWWGYMAATLPPSQLAAVMWRVFGQASNPLRLHLARHALRVAPKTLQTMFNSSSKEGGYIS
ncbi:lycopene cyclase family protein [Lujinxingia sediminis]|uniref:lycopene cyclase family protein n=1 Tax=Lujinxingia sediminis TaxID=2480984 RepID=UPI0013E33E46|nr:lycopene cyclase family protein [Lujinxingia sediminis]